jgi:succinyl-diaminopimelate desuccinylase
MELFNQVFSKIQEKEAIDLTRSLVKIRSIIGDEQNIGDYLSKELVKLGLSTEIIEAKKRRPNIISHIKGETDDVGLILVGHTDTVPIGEGAGESWKVDPFDGDLRDGLIRGLGSSDMKGGITSILLAVKAVTSTKVRFRKGLTIVFCVDEEGGSIDGLKYISEKKLIKGPLAIEPEPTNMCLQGWFKGRTWYNIEVKGKAAHSSAPSKGINAILNMLDILQKIKNVGFEYKKHELVGDCTINVGTIEGGTSVKSVPDLCKARLEVRTVPGQTGEGVRQSIINFINELKKTNPTLDASVSVIDGKDPIELSPKDPLVDRIQSSTQKAIGRKLELGRGGGAGGDIFFSWRNLGIPGFHFGPGEVSCAHAPNEHIKVSNIVNVSKCYAAFILDFCEGYV